LATPRRNWSQARGAAPWPDALLGERSGVAQDLFLLNLIELFTRRHFSRAFNDDL
jgi:hypothetical protein